MNGLSRLDYQSGTSTATAVGALITLLEYRTGAFRPCTAGALPRSYPYSSTRVLVFARAKQRGGYLYLSSLAVGSVGLCHKNGGPNK